VIRSWRACLDPEKSILVDLLSGHTTAYPATGFVGGYVYVTQSDPVRQNGVVKVPGNLQALAGGLAQI
jgi:hypothetical protein